MIVSYKHSTIIMAARRQLAGHAGHSVVVWVAPPPEIWWPNHINFRRYFRQRCDLITNIS